MTIAYNIDCAKYMQTLPDKAFDLCVADPPYGLNIMARHTHTHTAPRSSAEARDRSEEKAASIYAAAKSNLTNQRFIRSLTTAPRQTLRFSGSFSVSATS